MPCLEGPPGLLTVIFYAACFSRRQQSNGSGIAPTAIPRTTTTHDHHARPNPMDPSQPITTNKHVVHCVFLPQAAKQLAWSCANIQLLAILWYVVCCMTRNMFFTVCFSCRQQSSWLGVAGQVDVGSSQAGTAGGWGLAQPHHAADGAAIGLLVAQCSSATAVLMWVQCLCVENQR